MPATWPPRTVIRKSSGLRTLESALYRGGLGPVAGVDEVGRGACAGPLVVAACVLGPNRLESLASLDDSKKLNEKERERLFPLIRRYALAYHVVFIPSAEVDRRGVHDARTYAEWNSGNETSAGVSGAADVEELRENSKSHRIYTVAEAEE